MDKVKIKYKCPNKIPCEVTIGSELVGVGVNEKGEKRLFHFLISLEANGKETSFTYRSYNCFCKNRSELSVNDLMSALSIYLSDEENFYFLNT